MLAMNQGEVLALGHAGARCSRDPGVIEAYLGSADDVSSLRREVGMSDGPPP